uniref:CLASP_N domain-containing protein n=1 Tax=Macrostomum lignano TaxID=282301 RepID=A0A1I8FAW1_9PLAT
MELPPRRPGQLFSSYLAREGGPSLNQLELRRVCDIFAKMFGEPNGRVMQFFLEALADFVTRYHGELHDWLYTLLVRLVGRMATETLASQQARFQTAHGTSSASLSITLQLRCLRSPRVQAALLQCLLQVVRQLPADALVPWRNQSDQPGQEARIALSRLTTLTKDPKSPDVRRLSQAVLAALFDLNPGCFSAAVLKEMQPTIQQRATDVLKLQLRAQGRRSDIPASAETPQKQQQVSGPPSSAAATPARRCLCSRRSRQTSRRCGPTGRSRNPAAAAAAANAAADAGDALPGANSGQARPAGQWPAPPASALQPSRQQQQQQPPLTAGGPRVNSRRLSREGDSTPSRFQPVQKQQQQQQQQAPPAPATCCITTLKISTMMQELLDDDDEDIDGPTETPTSCGGQAAEDCAKHVAAHLPGDVCLRVLTPLVSGADPGLALAAVKNADASGARVRAPCRWRPPCPSCAQALVRCCDHAESQIRKAAIFCLFGETLLFASQRHEAARNGACCSCYICKARVGTAQDAGAARGGAGGLPCL